MNKEQLEEQAKFYEFVKKYEYLNNEGRLDIEAFSLYLTVCFACDGIKEKSPQPYEISDLLLNIMDSSPQNDKKTSWIQPQKLTDWSPEYAYMYPNKYRTYIHMGGLSFVINHWIYHIGHTLMGIPEPDSPSKYFDWVKPEWVFVFTFINGFHNYFFDKLKKIDRESANKKGYSAFETLHKATFNKLDFDQAANEIKKRNSARTEALERINIAIESGFYLEAITLQECLMSNCLYNYLQAKNVYANSLSFQKLIYFCKSKIESVPDIDLLNEIDGWRTRRNKSIHGFIESNSELLSKSQSNFDIFSKKTSLEGQVLCRRTCDWYLNESINFIPTEFPMENTETN